MSFCGSLYAEVNLGSTPLFTLSFFGRENSKLNVREAFVKIFCWIFCQINHPLTEKLIYELCYYLFHIHMTIPKKTVGHRFLQKT